MMNERRFTAAGECGIIQILQPWKMWLRANTVIKGAYDHLSCSPEGPLIMQVNVFFCYTFVVYVNASSREMSKMNVSAVGSV